VLGPVRGGRAGATLGGAGQFVPHESGAHGLQIVNVINQVEQVPNPGTRIGVPSLTVKKYKLKRSTKANPDAVPDLRRPTSGHGSYPGVATWTSRAPSASGNVELGF
jgi:hypothetical protein